MAREGAREREMHRYYRPWLETFMSTELEPVVHLPPTDRDKAHRPRSSRDKGLTAFAQLGCLRLNAKRGLITLLDSTKQYIIAEATKSLSLLSDSQHAPGDELWFGNSFIERDQGVSADAMYPETYTANGSDGSAYSAPALVVGDIALHDKYKTRAFAGHGVSFYCGVPIATKLGHVIGVYTVTDDKPREGLSPDELRFMVDMTVIVVQHLETVKNDRARKRGERLIRGIGTFIEGNDAEESSHAHSDLPSHPSHSTEEVNASKKPMDWSPPSLSAQTNRAGFLGMVIGDANALSEESNRLGHPASDGPVKNELERNKPLRSTSKDDANSEAQQTAVTRGGTGKKERALSESERVFDRAAAILRFCLSADGAVFLNANSANLSSGSNMQTSGTTPSKIHHSRAHPKRLPPDVLDEASNPGLRESVAETVPHDSSDSNSSTATTRSNSDSSTSKVKRQKSEVLGLSSRDPRKTVSIPEQILRRFVRRHPDGKCYTFDQFGRPASSDDSSESASATIDNDSQGDVNQASKAAKYVPTTNALLKALPGARNIVFLPLWDFARERWHSGVIVWSNAPGTLTNIHDDMLYLKAFGNAVMNEVNRIDLALSDNAKSTFLANISHELRSPLHGILGSIEFLHDTAMDDFQATMVTSVETCGKTLLDTVNHVLDHAKINNLSKSGRRIRSKSEGAPHSTTSETSLIEDFDMAVVVEEVVEAIYAGQVFRSANADALEGKSTSQTAASRAVQRIHEREGSVVQGAAGAVDPVRLTLNIDQQTSWKVRSQPGAVRRIVMNILGNSLKYTSTGSIDVALELDDSRKKSHSKLHMLIKVADTGRGMSGLFMKNHAFTAFSQEDSFATGTGLGLSIVRQIVDSLGGKIELASEKDVGTEIKIWLSLPKSQKDPNPDVDKDFMRQVRERTKDLEMCMLLSYGEKQTEGRSPLHGMSLSPLPTVESSMQNLVTQWFNMKLTSGKMMEGLTPHFFLYPEPPPIEYLIYLHGQPDAQREIPVIVLCHNAFQAASLRSNGIHRLTDIGRIIELIPQPCGPQKLAKALHRCMHRIQLLEEDITRRSSDDVPLLLRQESKVRSRTEAPTDAITKQDKRPDRPDNVWNGNASYANRPPLSQRGTSENERYIQSEIPDSLVSFTDPDNTKPRILVVDDNHINLHLLVTFVKRTGHPYESATDGLMALETYKRSVIEDKARHPFKYVLMDISMPVMDGLTSTKEIRKFEEETRGVLPARIIALTGLGNEIAKKEAFDAGVDQFLSKPVKFKELQKLLV